MTQPDDRTDYTAVIVDLVRGKLAAMTPEQRYAVLEKLFEGYCRHCGADESKHRCHCTNDE